MEVLRSYVLRVYRHDSDGIAGVLESVETGDAIAFRSPEELWASICRPLSVRRSQPSSAPNRRDGK